MSSRWPNDTSLKPRVPGPQAGLSRPSHILPIVEPTGPGSGHQATKYSYTRLPTSTCIRLLRLNPLHTSSGLLDGDRLYDPIECSIEVVDLDDLPRYEALSYAWGDPLVFYRDHDKIFPQDAWYAPSFEIQCDGKPVSVTANLYAALIAVRAGCSLKNSQVFSQRLDDAGYAKEIAHIWIDQLCINQDDMDERAQQVSMMGRIYRDASTVLAWLGGEDDTATEAVALMNTLCKLSLRVFFQLRGTYFLEPKVYAELGIQAQDIGLRHWLSLYCFLNRSWFKRAWVIQEMGLARRASSCWG